MRITRKIALEKALEANEGIHEELFNQIDREIFMAAKAGKFRCQVDTGSCEAQEAVMNEYLNSGFGVSDEPFGRPNSFPVNIFWRL